MSDTRILNEGLQELLLLTTQAERPVFLPRWLRVAFWSVVAAEWTVVFTVAIVINAAVFQVVVAFALACVPDTTVYASSYSEASWAAIRAGDTQGAVRARLGQPLYRWSHHDDEWWSYSKQRTGTDNYRERKLRFALDGRVLEKHETCYLD